MRHAAAFVLTTLMIAPATACFDPGDSSGSGTESGSSGTSPSGGTTPTGPTSATMSGSTDPTNSTDPTSSTDPSATGDTSSSTDPTDPDSSTSATTDTGTTGGPEGWQERRRIDFVASILDDGLTDFPVLVVLNDARIDYSLTQDDGADVRFYDRNENPLAYEIEDWDETADSIVWVRVAEIDANDDHFFMDYGNDAAVDAQDAASVWAGAYEAVYHMADSPAGGTLTDSTGNGHDGTLSPGNDIASVAGRIGPAMVFDGDESITVPDHPGLDYSDTVSLEGWVNPVTVDVTVAVIVRRSFYYALEAVRFVNNPGGISIREGGITIPVALSSDLTPGDWAHLAGTWSSAGTMRLFLDGGLHDTNVSNGMSIPVNSTDITIGSTFSGTLDELRIAPQQHSDTWVSAQHESMADNLLTFGPPIDPP